MCSSLQDLNGQRWFLFFVSPRICQLSRLWRFFLCAYFFLRYVLHLAGLVNYEYIFWHGGREKHQLSKTIIFHFFEQMTGCQKDETFYSYRFSLQKTCMSVFCENSVHLHVAFFTMYFFLTAMAERCMKLS